MKIKNIEGLHNWLSNMLLQNYITKADIKEVIDNFDWNMSIPMDAEVKPALGGEPLTLTGQELEQMIELIEICYSREYETLHNKLLNKAKEIAENISPKSV